MHQSSMLRMEWFLKTFLSEKKERLKVLDVGSYDVNGSYKILFPESEFDYTGIDMEGGPNVDWIVKTPYHWPEFATDSFDLVISGQAFEHNEFFWLTLEEMTRILKPGGKMCIIAPNGFAEHRFPVDCYRFFSDGMVAMARYVQLDVLHASTNASPKGQEKAWCSESEADSILVAQKNYSGEAKLVDRRSYSCVPPVQENNLGELINYHKPKDNLVQKLLLKLYRKAKFFG